jgi:hypothetical protein
MICTWIYFFIINNFYLIFSFLPKPQTSNYIKSDLLQWLLRSQLTVCCVTHQRKSVNVLYIQKMIWLQKMKKKKYLMVFKVFVAASIKHHCFRNVTPRQKVFGYWLSQQHSDVICKGLIFVELQTLVDETITLSRNVMSQKSWQPKKT